METDHEEGDTAPTPNNDLVSAADALAKESAALEADLLDLLRRRDLAQRRLTAYEASRRAARTTSDDNANRDPICSGDEGLTSVFGAVDEFLDTSDAVVELRAQLETATESETNLLALVNETRTRRQQLTDAAFRLHAPDLAAWPSARRVPKRGVKRPGVP